MSAMKQALYEFWLRLQAFSLAVLVHALAALLVVFGTMDWKPFKPPDLTALTIEAVIVDTQALKDKKENARREAEAAQRREELREQRQRELEAQKAREQREADEAERERQRQEAQRKREAEMRLQQLREQQERDRQEKLAQQQAELEALRKQREEAERQRKIEEERLKQLQARREAEAEARRQAEAQAALQEQMDREAQEFRAGQLATLAQQYALAIQSQVTGNWLRPPTARPGLRCTLRIIQIPGGEVISANIAGSCNGDEATRRSLIAAVERAGTLPYRGFEDVFSREIDFIFRYDGE